jgi:hypothetical protein
MGAKLPSAEKERTTADVSRRMFVILGSFKETVAYVLH